MAQADHEVDVPGPPGPRGHRHDRQQVAIVAEDARDPLERRRPDVHRLDRRAAARPGDGAACRGSRRGRPGRAPPGTSRRPASPSASRAPAPRGARIAADRRCRRPGREPDGRSAPPGRHAGGTIELILADAGIHAGLPNARVNENGRPSRLRRVDACPAYHAFRTGNLPEIGRSGKTGWDLRLESEWPEARRLDSTFGVGTGRYGSIAVRDGPIRIALATLIQSFLLPLGHRRHVRFDRRWHRRRASVSPTSPGFSSMPRDISFPHPRSP